MRTSDAPNPFETPMAAVEKEEEIIEIEDDDRKGPPWEELGNPIGKFVQTVIAVLVRPSDTFQKMRRFGGISPATTFGICAGSLGFVGFVIVTVLYLLWVMPEKRGGEHGLALVFLFLVYGLGSSIAGAMLMLAGMALGTCLLHLALRMVGGARRPMATTYRTFAYSLATFTVWGVVPLVGLAIGAVHFAIVVAIGLANLHGIGMWRSIAAEALAVIPPIALFIAALYLASG